jgi:hypothetical protein
MIQLLGWETTFTRHSLSACVGTLLAGWRIVRQFSLLSLFDTDAKIAQEKIG